MNKTERAVIKNTILRLRGTKASKEVAEALTGPAGLYLETWVIPALELILKEKPTRDDRDLAVKLVR